jgi:hypothetical protein
VPRDDLAQDTIVVARNALRSLGHRATRCTVKSADAVSCRDRARDVWTIQVSPGGGWTASDGHESATGQTIVASKTVSLGD